MFTRVAPRYDMGNALMTVGLSRLWRREIVRRAGPQPDDLVLDLATGTGQLARDIVSAQPHARVFGADTTRAMLDRAVARPGGTALVWACVDAHSLPFPNDSVDVITHGYLLRYLRLEAGLREQFRVLAPGGRVVALETATGGPGLTGRAAAAVAALWPRVVSRLIGQEQDDYAFLGESSLTFRQPEEILSALRAAGFTSCGHRPFLAGMLAVYWGTKPRNQLSLRRREADID